MRNPQRKTSSITPRSSSPTLDQDPPEEERKLSLPLLHLSLPRNAEEGCCDMRRKPSFFEEYLRCPAPAKNFKEIAMNGGGVGRVRSCYGIRRVRADSKESPRALISRYFGEVENKIFEIFGNRETQKINVYKFFSGLLETGLRLNDPRLKETIDGLRTVQEKFYSSDEKKFEMDYDAFLGIISHNLEIIVKAFSFLLVIPDFGEFIHSVNELYYLCQKNVLGQVASYIPQLSRASPDLWGVAICTVDGQRHSIGDVNVPFTVQSCSYAPNYAFLVTLKGGSDVHQFIGMESSGRHFSEICLDYNSKPHNPMINAGAIMTAALIKPELSCADRFDYVFNQYKKLCGGEYLGFNNAVFLSERECADRNFALAYFMRENKCFPPGTKISEVLDFYFQLCSLEITAESGAVIAATLANGGINPLTNEPVLTVEAVRNTLALMHSCGMYNYSGQFAFQVGLPAKSGVSGCILLVVPNTLGICLWSPALDLNGNSCRGVQFCKELVSKFKFHHFDNLRGPTCNKVDPRIGKCESKAQAHFDLLFSVAAGDISAVRRHTLAGTNINGTDYDGRTALHIAAAEGHVEIVEFLLENCHVFPHPKDRWGRTPLDDSQQFKNVNCEKLIENHLLMRSNDQQGSSILLREADLALPNPTEDNLTPKTPFDTPYDVASSIAEVLTLPSYPNAISLTNYNGRGFNESEGASNCSSVYRSGSSESSESCLK